MSATIDTNDLKFVIFGAGYDGTLPDSGEGGIRKVKPMNFTASYASFDATGQYCWLVSSSSNIPSGIHKFDMLNDWEEVSQSIIDTEVATILLHPTNSENNYGIALTQSGYMQIDFTVFDMTDDTVIKTGTIAWNIGVGGYECALIGDYIYFITTDGKLWTIDTVNQTVSIDNPNRILSFIDDHNICAIHDITWFSDWARYMSYDYSLNVNWEVMAQKAGANGFGTLLNFCANGYIYGLFEDNGKWKFGEYNGNGTSDFYTPTPTKVLKQSEVFDSLPSLSNLVYSTDKAYGAFWIAGKGIYYTDFDKVSKLDDASSFHTDAHPVGMDDHYILVTSNDSNEMKLYTYR